MITGDNTLTAASIGYLSGILDSNKKTYICEFNDEKNAYYLEKFNDKDSGMDEEIKCGSLGEIIHQVEVENAQLCLSGKCCNHILER